MAGRHEEGCHEGTISKFLACKKPSNDDVGLARCTVFNEIRTGAGFQTDDIANEKLGELPQNDPYGEYFGLICLRDIVRRANQSRLCHQHSARVIKSWLCPQQSANKEQRTAFNKAPRTSRIPE